jgi:hypothetical protein
VVAAFVLSQTNSGDDMTRRTIATFMTQQHAEDFKRLLEIIYGPLFEIGKDRNTLQDGYAVTVELEKYTGLRNIKLVKKCFDAGLLAGQDLR